MVKSKVPPQSESVVLRQLNYTHKKGPSSFFLKVLTHEIKPTQNNESELGDIYTLFIYRSISFYRKLLKSICKFSMHVRLAVRGISHGTLLPLTLKTSLKMNLVNIFNSTKIACVSYYLISDICH